VLKILTECRDVGCCFTPTTQPYASCLQAAEQNRAREPVNGDRTSCSLTCFQHPNRRNANRNARSPRLVAGHADCSPSIGNSV
jgi:hypothetical protein